MTELLVLGGAFIALVVGLYFAARAAGYHKAGADRREATTQRAARRQQIDSEVARMGDAELDDELRGPR